MKCSGRQPVFIRKNASFLRLCLDMTTLTFDYPQRSSSFPQNRTTESIESRRRPPITMLLLLQLRIRNVTNFYSDSAERARGHYYYAMGHAPSSSQWYLTWQLNESGHFKCPALHHILQCRRSRAARDFSRQGRIVVVVRSFLCLSVIADDDDAFYNAFSRFRWKSGRGSVSMTEMLSVNITNIYETPDKFATTEFFIPFSSKEKTFQTRQQQQRVIKVSRRQKWMATAHLKYDFPSCWLSGTAHDIAKLQGIAEKLGCFVLFVGPASLKGKRSLRTRFDP